MSTTDHNRLIFLAVDSGLYAFHKAEVITRTYDSGPQWSGRGKDFSDWYTLESDEPPPGYVVSSASFRLIGDRTCGSFAECKKQSQTARKVIWEFRMQGHEEGPRENVSFYGWLNRREESAGILTVNFVSAANG